MVGPKLKKYIDSYLGVPYWRNQVDQDGTIKKEGPFAGKGNPNEIYYASKCAAFQEKLNFESLNPEQIHSLQEKYQIGIDCSGLVYNLLDSHLQDLGFPGIYYYLRGVWRGVNRYGVRSVYASNFANPENSKKIEDINRAKVGDYICLMGKDEIGHVIMISNIGDSFFECIHTSSESKQKNVHNFVINQTQKKHIQDQDWQEVTNTGDNFLDLFDLNNQITGLYRLNVLCP